MERKLYHPVFAGRTLSDDKKIVVYKHVDRENELFIEFPDSDLVRDFWALNPDTTTIHTRFELDTQLFHIRIESSEWTGEAKGSKVDLLETPAR